MIVADGRCHYAMRIETASGRCAEVMESLGVWREKVREQRGWGADTIEGVMEQVRRIPHVQQVLADGPRSSIPLAMFMAMRLTGLRGSFLSHLGKGPLADALLREFSALGADYTVVRRLDTDMPGELLVFDPAQPGVHGSVVIYPSSRTSYRHRTHVDDETIAKASGLLLNRANEGLLKMAQKMTGAGKRVSLRIHEYGQYADFEDYKRIFPFVHQLVLSENRGVLRETARHLGVEVPRGWPSNGLYGPMREIAERVDALAGRRLMHVHILEPRHELVAVTGAMHRGVRVCPEIPPGAPSPDMKYTARAQGAALAFALRPPEGVRVDDGGHPADQQSLNVFAEWTLKAAHHGLLDVPWEWPDTRFTIAGFQMRRQRGTA